MAIGMYTAYVETPQTTHKKSSVSDPQGLPAAL